MHPYQQQQTTGPGKKGVIIFCACAAVGFFALVGILNYHPKTTASPQATNSASASERTIAGPGRALLAVDERAYDDMMSAAVANDNAALMRMGVDGKVFALDEGTRVRIVDGGLFKSRVSALEGRQAGRAGWLPNHLLSH